jgi:hypothetical protein
VCEAWDAKQSSEDKVLAEAGVDTGHEVGQTGHPVSKLPITAIQCNCNIEAHMHCDANNIPGWDLLVYHCGDSLVKRCGFFVQAKVFP